MSGPKTAQWRLVDASTPGAMSLQEGQAQLQVYFGKIDALAGELAALQETLAAPPAPLDRSTPQSAAALVAALQNAQEHYNLLLSAKTEAQARLDLAKRLQRFATGAGATRRPGAEALRQTTLDKAQRLLPGGDPGLADMISRLVDELARLPMGADDRIEAASKALKAAIDKSNTAVRERDAERRQRRRAQSRPAGALLVSLLGIETAAADALRGELEAAQHGEAVLTSELIQRAQAAASTPEVLARKRDHEARRAAAILRAALTDLNYQVGDDFETCFAGGGETLLHKPATDRAWQDHACQMTIDPDTHAVDLRIVRFSDNPEATRDEVIEDAQVEQQWCGDVSRLTDKLGQRGLTLALLRAEPAGKQPVRRLTRKATGRRRAAEHAVVRALPTQPS